MLFLKGEAEKYPAQKGGLSMCITSFFLPLRQRERRVIDACLGLLWISAIAFVLYFSSQDLPTDTPRDVLIVGLKQHAKNLLYAMVPTNTKN